MQPLTDVLADPGMAAGTLAIPGQHRLGIDGQQPALLVGVDPRSQPAADVDLRGRKRIATEGRPAGTTNGTASGMASPTPGNASNPFTSKTIVQLIG